MPAKPRAVPDRAVQDPAQRRQQPLAGAGHAAARRIAGLADLTPAERLVLHCFLVSADDKRIARRLSKRPHTVRNQLASAIKKLQVGSREQLLIYLFTGEKPWLRQNAHDS